jgi:hypothetical protein
VEVVDELREVLDGVDVMVGGWGDERHPRFAPPQACDVWAHFLAGQLPALTRLGPLRDLDFQLV